ncbi:MAG: TFIIB-type zinc ribbon-containing protein, partial [Candidatus Hydrothermarchaeota archaeon]|nr:TFIIB-type zinc ribbon-containing protein [Candidatus Hydrothermarchaeota archaeon]
MVERKVEYTEICPECNSKSLTKDYERAEIVCNDCGLVIDEKIMDTGPEWRAFDYEQ